MMQKIVIGLMCCALCLLLGVGKARAEQLFDRDTPIRTVLEDPAFGSYGRLIFPVDEGYYSGDTLAVSG